MKLKIKFPRLELKTKIYIALFFSFLLILSLISYIITSQYYFYEYKKSINEITEINKELMKFNEKLEADNNQLRESLNNLEELYDQAQKIKYHIMEKRREVEKLFRVRVIPNEEITEIAYAFLHVSKKYNIPITTLLTIGWVESWYDRNAIGPCGERGLIQVWGKTFDSINRNLKLSANFHEWRDTLEVGAIYLRDLQNRYKSYQNDVRYDLIFAGYNGGSGNANAVILRKETNTQAKKTVKNYVSRARVVHREVLERNRTI